MAQYWNLLTAAVAVCGVSAVAYPNIVSAQHIEETYAKLCAEPQASKSETCVALRAALVQKLTSQASPPSATIREVKAPTTSAAWGALPSLDGTYWQIEPGHVVSFYWEKPGEVFIEEWTSIRDVGQQRRYERKPGAESLVVTLANGETHPVQILASGEFATPLTKLVEGQRQVYSITPEVIRARYEINKAGVWSDHPAGLVTMKRIDAPTFDAKIENIRKFYSTAADPNVIASRWGFYARAVGYTWEHKAFSGYREFRSYSWVEPGISMEEATWVVFQGKRQNESSKLIKLDVTTQRAELVDGDGVWRVGDSYTVQMSGAESFEQIGYSDGKVFMRQRYTRSDVIQARRAERAELINGVLAAGIQAAGETAAQYSAQQSQAALRNARRAEILGLNRPAGARPTTGQVAGVSRPSTRSYAPQAVAIAAQAQPAPTPTSVSSAADSNTKSGGPENAPRDGLSVRAVNAYFVIPMLPKAGNTINPNCYSSIFPISFPFDPKGWGNAGRANAVLDPMKPAFVAKCRAAGVVDKNGVAIGNVEGVSSGFPRGALHPEHYQVTMP